MPLFFDSDAGMSFRMLQRELDSFLAGCVRIHSQPKEAKGTDEGLDIFKSEKFPCDS